MKTIAVFAVLIAAAWAVPENPSDQYIVQSSETAKDTLVDTLPLHNVYNSPFQYNILVLSMQGKANLTNGSVSRLRSYQTVGLQRYADNKFWITLRFPLVTFKYMYSVIFDLMFGNNGQIDGQIRDLILSMPTRVENGLYVLDGLPVFHMPDVQVAFSKGSLIDLVYNLLSFTFIQVVKHFTSQEFAVPICMEIVKNMNIASKTQ